MSPLAITLILAGVLLMARGTAAGERDMIHAGIALVVTVVFTSII